LDNQAVMQYQHQQAWEEQQALRDDVKQKFLSYLKEDVEPLAAEWLELHLQGKSQEAIAATLNLPIKQVYRLREKISYHALRVFAVKSQPDLVSGWLGASLEQNLGLAPQDWQTFLAGLTLEQKKLIEDIKAQKTPEAIARERNLKVSQVTGEWTKLYLAAHALRASSRSSRAESGEGQ
jgi:hypothetical protein